MMAFSCEEKNAVQPLRDNIVRLKSGQSFGMCIGKCYNELIVENNSVILKQVERKERGGSDTESIEHRDNSLLNQIKADLAGFPKDKFLRLKDQYGYPDYADGGAEWLEIEFTDGTIKNVKFEYGSPLEGFEEIISSLRTYRLSLMDKYR